MKLYKSNTSALSISSRSFISTAIDTSGTNLEMPSRLSRYTYVHVCSVLQPQEIDNFDILLWWRCNERQYQAVSKVVCNLLIPWCL